jgi:LuxR family maltose regulon positive regulatory protein
VRSFGDIVTVAARAGIYHTILDEGAQLGPLLTAFQENAERTGGFREFMSYLSSLIVTWRSRYQSEDRQTPTSAIAERQQTPTAALAESLSERERGILKLIAEGQSNKEIARQLAIAPETVKSHVKHIFTKLNVEKRAQAVSRAQSLGVADTR